MGLSKYKLTEQGEALLKAAQDKESSVKGDLTKGRQRFNIQTLTDQQAEILMKPDGQSPYVEEVKK